jgi:hypothetical protein
MQLAESFDDLVGAGEDQRRDRETQRSRRFHVDHQFEPARLLDREVSWLDSLQDAINEIGLSPRRIEEVRTIGWAGSRA